MPDLSRRQARILFELSNGKRLVVAEDADQAFICSDDELDDPRRGVVASFSDYVRLSETECLTPRERRTVDGLGVATAYAASRGGLETLFETSMSPKDE
jgi:hypothetical protein